MTKTAASFRVGAIQAAPVYFDLAASVEKAVRLIRQAAAQGAELVAFGESWLPGYPLHALGAAASPAMLDMASDYLATALDLAGEETQALCDAARETGVDVVIGVSEVDPTTRGSLYSTLLFIGAEGDLLARHRKLRPCPHERGAWADGDAGDIRAHVRSYASISGLVGADHQMALPTYALAEQGTELHVAAFAGALAADPRRASPWASQDVLARAFALQAGCYVVCVGAVLTPANLPEDIRALAGEGFAGASMVIDPRGVVVAGPASGETILYVDCLRASIRAAKVNFDCAGHSARRDQLRLSTPVSQMSEAQSDPGEFPNGDTTPR